MEIRYKDKKIRELCEKQAVAERKLGAPCARKLRSRLGDLEAHQRVSELTFGNPHPLKGDRLVSLRWTSLAAGAWCFHRPTPLRPRIQMAAPTGPK